MDEAAGETEPLERVWSGMATVSQLEPPTSDVTTMVPARRWSLIARDLLATPSVLAGGGIVLVFLIVALVGPAVAAYSATAFSSQRLAPPSLAHPFGTDEFGRDMLSRVIGGARISGGLALAATVFSLVLGIPIGLVAGYFGGWADEILMRVTDALLSLPSLILALLIVASLGSGLQNVVLAIGVVYAPRIGRVIRSGVLGLRHAEFVQAARARGESSVYIMGSEILPNILSPLIVEASIRMGFALLLAASLSYLGLGVSPPTPDWGLMINDARQYMLQAPWLVIFPSLAVALAIVGFNLLGDGIRDILDPRRGWVDRRAESA